MKNYQNCSTGNTKKFICIEGNIGSGKSTFIRKLSENFNYSVVPEPTDQWQNINGLNILDSFYKDTDRWAYTFQSFVFLTRIKAIEEKLNGTSIENFFVERSVFADKNTFAKACYELGHINELEWNIYNHWHKWMVDYHCPIPSGFIYLRVSPEVSLARIKKRARYEETNISMDYLKRLHDCHESWLINGLNEVNGNRIPVLILDCNDDFQYNEKNWNALAEKVDDFIKKCFFNYNFFDMKGLSNERISK